MNADKKACCARAAGWGLVGIVIAIGWGMGNLTNGMNILSAFAIPGLIVLGILGVVIMGTLDVPWFKRLCVCEGDAADESNLRDPGSTTS